MRDRLEIIKRLLADDGSLWITIDDNECHYLKILCDEIFGRKNFVANVVWQKRTSPESRLQLGPAHDHILVYSGNINYLKFNKLVLSETHTNNYKNPDNDNRGLWVSTDFTAQGWRPNQMYKIKTFSGVEYEPPPGRCWSNVEEEYKKLLSDNRIWFGKNGDSRPRIKNFLKETKGVSAWTWWVNSEVGHNQEGKKEINKLFGADDSFDTPKPERLLKRVIEIATKPGDLILDSFAGSGTTGAVAHKIGRRWIMVELGSHCYTHCIPRLRKVIDGEDFGGISMTHKTTEAVKLCKVCKESLCEDCRDKVGDNIKGGEQKWFGGGGFRFYELGPSLIAEDEWGNPVINSEFNPAMLAEAMCKLEGFTYAPSEEHYWVHGHSTETDFIYVTTQFMSKAMLDKLSDDVGPDRSLMIYCSAFKADVTQFPNLTINKIPKAVLKKCEWGRDDYSLAVANLPAAPQLPIVEPDSPLKEKREKKKDKQPLLPGFDV